MSRFKNLHICLADLGKFVLTDVRGIRRHLELIPEQYEDMLGLLQPGDFIRTAEKN